MHAKYALLATLVLGSSGMSVAVEPASAASAPTAAIASAQTDPAAPIPLADPAPRSKSPAVAAPSSATFVAKSVSIEALAEVQKHALEAEALKQMGVTLSPAPSPPPIPVTTVVIKPPAPAAPKPYLASVFGPVGEEEATFVVAGRALTRRKGETLQGATIVAIDGARVQVDPGPAHKGKARNAPRPAYWIHVGDTLR